jgi:predicted flap endonuclease-1-like 5' DNA nuclease
MVAPDADKSDVAKSDLAEPAAAVAMPKPKRTRKPKVASGVASEPAIAALVAAPVTEPVAHDLPAPRAERAGAKRTVVRKPKAALSSAAAIIADGFAPVAALQEAVAAALAPKVRPAPHAPAAAAGSITTIPSLGPGLIWRLNQCGIHTLADLAACEPDDLRGRLGRIGRIANVEQWIQHARSA